MKITNKAQAGSFESSDILILVEPNKSGNGRNIQLNSIVEKQFGDTILQIIHSILDNYNIDDIHIVINDKGALDPVIKARMETVLLRASNKQKGTLH